MHAIKKIKKIRAFFLLRSELQKPGNNTNLTKPREKHARFGQTCKNRSNPLQKPQKIIFFAF